MNNKWVRSISFNKTNEKDMARLNLIGKKSFSRYIKKLLDEEIKRTSNTPQKPTPIKPTPIKPKKSQVFNPMLNQ